MQKISARSLREMQVPLKVKLINGKTLYGYTKDANNLAGGVTLRGKNNSVAFIPATSILMVIRQDKN